MTLDQNLIRKDYGHSLILDKTESNFQLAFPKRLRSFTTH